MKALLDEHITPRAARLLRERGHDVVAVTECPDLIGAGDEQLWRTAMNEGRAIVTENARDFALLANQPYPAGSTHAGLVLLSPRAGPTALPATTQLVGALARLIAAYPGEAFAGRVAWLEPPRRDA